MTALGKRQSLPEWVEPAFCVCLCFTLVMTAVAMFTGQWVTKLHFYYSYELQAENWLKGSLEIEDGEDYTWLELAVFNGDSYATRHSDRSGRSIVQAEDCWLVYDENGELTGVYDDEEDIPDEGHYFVSFPPFPSYLMLPFVALCGTVQIEDGWIAWFVAMIACIYAVRLYIAVTGGTKRLWLMTLFLLVSNGYVYVTMNAWVWFIAQNLCFALTLAALYYAQVGRGGASFALWACAVGCRPVSAIWFPLLAVLVIRHCRQEYSWSTARLILRRWYWGIAPLLLGGSYMLLNYLRFGNCLQFGHDYLPEFTRTETGQFDLSYLLPNLLEYLRLPEWNGSGESVSFYPLNGNAFYLVNPVLIFFAVSALIALIRRKGPLPVRILLPLLVILNLVILCLHRTLGGVQFGNRYLLDLIPYAWYGLILWQPESKRFESFVLSFAAFGAAVNLLGTVYSYNNLL